MNLILTTRQTLRDYNFDNINETYFQRQIIILVDKLKKNIYFILNIVRRYYKNYN